MSNNNNHDVLLFDAFKKLYTYGTVSLEYTKNNQTEEKRLFIKDNTLHFMNIKYVNNNNNVESQELPINISYSYLSDYLYYSLFPDKSYNVILTFNNEEENYQVQNLDAVREFYSLIVFNLSIKKENMESIITYYYNNHSFRGAFNYSDINVDFSYRSMRKLLLSKLESFSKTFFEGLSIYEKTQSKSLGDDDFNKYTLLWDQFLNNLSSNYPDVSTDFSKEKEKKKELSISYDFITDESYSNHPAFCRELEMRKMQIALLSNQGVLLVGDKGVGKTALVHGLAYQIKNNQTSDFFKDKKIMLVNSSSIVKGCNLVGMIEENVEQLMLYLKNHPNTILFIDDIHTIVGAGASSKNNLDISNIMKSYLDKDHSISIIGTTTTQDYEELVKYNSFLSQFRKITIKEPLGEDLLTILLENIKLENENNKYDVRWDFSYDETINILNIIIKATQKGHFIYNDIRCNPYTSIDIIRSSFAICALDGEKIITRRHIAEAIQCCEYLYDSTRDDASIKINSNYTGKRKTKILSFPNNYNNYLY